MLIEVWYVYKKLDAIRRLPGVKMWYLCDDRDDGMICHNLHEDERSKVLARSKESELDLKLLSKSVQLDVIIKCSCYNGQLCKYVYLDPMWCLFDEVAVAGNIWEHTAASKITQCFHSDSWNYLMADYMLYKQGDMDLTLWRKMQHTTNSDQMKDLFGELERYMKRHEIFSCLTYYIEGNVGIHTSCSFACHDDHDAVELWAKRKLRGNRRTSTFRVFFYKIFPSKYVDNVENLCNHDLSGWYCTCKGRYPDVDVKGQVKMFQCCICEDGLIEEHHLDFKSPDEISRDKDLVYKPLTWKHSKIRSMEHEKNGGTVATPEFAQVMYVIFKEMKSVEITLDEITNWCILSFCAREGLRKEGWCFFETFGKNGLYLNIDISFTKTIQHVFIVEFLVVNQKAKNLFSFDWGKAKRVMKTCPAKTEYKITGRSKKICKNTPEYLSKQVLETTYLGSENVEMFEGKKEVHLGDKKKMKIEISIRRSLIKLCQVLRNTAISVEAIKVHEFIYQILKWSTGSNGDVEEHVQFPHSSYNGVKKEVVVALWYLGFYIKDQKVIVTVGEFKTLVLPTNSCAYALHNVPKRNTLWKFPSSEAKSTCKGGSLIALVWSMTRGVHETTTGAPRTLVSHPLNATRPVDVWELLVLFHLCASLILQVMQFVAAWALEYMLSASIGASYVFFLSVKICPGSCCITAPRSDAGRNLFIFILEDKDDFKKGRMS